MPSLFIALPCYGSVEPYFMGSMLALTRAVHSAQNPPFTIHTEMCVGNPSVGHARNALSARFLKSDCTHLLFIDTDLMFAVQDVVRLVSVSQQEQPAVVCGRYALKMAEPRWSYEDLPGDPELRPSGAVEVAYSGTGFMLIAREVLEGIRKAETGLEYDDGAGGGTAWNFFHAHVNMFRRYLHEDYAFSALARRNRFPVFVVPQVLCRHVGRAIYPLN